MLGIRRMFTEIVDTSFFPQLESLKEKKKTVFRRTNIFAHISGSVARQVTTAATTTTTATTTAKKDREFSFLCSRYSRSPTPPCPALPWPPSLFLRCPYPSQFLLASATKSKAFRPKNFSKVREQRNRQTWKDQVTRERLRPSPGGRGKDRNGRLAREALM